MSVIIRTECRERVVLYMRELCELVSLISLSGEVYTMGRNAVLNVGKQEGNVKTRDAQAD